jgi:DNA polymerase-3 subunit chi
VTQILFHVQVADRLGYACRLLRKAVRQGARVAVTAPEPTLMRFDKMLWSFDPTEFVPHVLLRGGDVLASRLQATPIVLVTESARAAQCSVLVNVGDDAAEGFEDFERLIEIVSTRDDEREAGRRRWRHYLAQGHAPRKHEAGA